MNVAVVGCGRLGAPLALLLAEAGLDVTGVDTSLPLIGSLVNAEAPWHEAGLPEMLETWTDEIDWSTDIADTAEAEVVFVVVPTPSLPSGAFDITAVLDVVAQVARNDVSQAVCVVSTVNPGDCEGRIAQALTASDADLVYSPEFIALGDVFAGMRRPDLTLIGEQEKWAGDRVLTCLRAIKPGQSHDLISGQRFVPTAPAIHRMSLTEAEIAKLSVNAYVTMKISFANSLGELCELHGVRGETVARAIGSDSRIGPKYLRPGRAYGGPCFPRDNAALIASDVARSIGSAPLPLAQAAQAVNDAQVNRFLDLILQLSDPWGRVCVLGMSYKPGTAVTDHSFGQALAWALEECDREVTTWDPLVATSWSTFAGATLHADVVVLANDDPAFRGPFPDTVIVDCMGLDGLDLTGCKQYVRAGDGTTL